MISCRRKRKNNHHRWIIATILALPNTTSYTLFLRCTTQTLFLPLLCVPLSTCVYQVLWYATSPAAQFKEGLLTSGAVRLIPRAAKFKDWSFLYGGCLWDVDNDASRQEDDREEKLYFRCCDVVSAFLDICLPLVFPGNLRN